MNKFTCGVILLFVGLATFSASWSMDEFQGHDVQSPKGVNKSSNYIDKCFAGFKKTGEALAQATVDSYALPLIGLGFLYRNPDFLKKDGFTAAATGSVFTASFVKNLLPRSWKNNFLIKTWSDYPFFTFIAGHQLLFNRDALLERYPLETMLVGCVLTYRCACNYLGIGDTTSSNNISSNLNDSTALLAFLLSMKGRWDNVLQS